MFSVSVAAVPLAPLLSRSFRWRHDSYDLITLTSGLSLPTMYYAGIMRIPQPKQDGGSRVARAIGLLSLIVSFWAVTMPYANAAQQGRSAPLRETLLASSGDAYVREIRTAEGRRWRLGTALVEKEVRLADGHLSLVSFRDPATRHEYVQGASDVLRFDWNNQPVTGHSTAWVLDKVATQRLKQGELLLQLSLHTADVAVVKHYLLYPTESIIQEWLTITNRSARPAVLGNPASLELHVMQDEVPAIDFHYMVGYPVVQNTPEVMRFHTYQLAGAEVRTFESGPLFDYAPIHVYQNRDTKNGVFVGWDYSGRWRSVVGDTESAPVHIGWLAVYEEQLPPGESLETPKAFTGMFHGDLDDMGHQLLDYQYRYKWDYTNPKYFPTTQLEADWAGSSWTTGLFETNKFDPITLYRQVFHMVDMMRDVGADVFWRDYGWWDRQGDWNAPNWGETRRYLAQYGMSQTIYLPIQDIDTASKVAKAHPDWLRSPGMHTHYILDQSNPAVIDWQFKLLESKRQQWGDFEWRRDFLLIVGKDRHIEQDRGFRGLVQRLLDRYPQMAHNGCIDAGYETLRMAMNWTAVDVGSNVLPWVYYFSYLFPLDKLDEAPDNWKPNDYNKAEWRGLLTNRPPMMGTTEDPAKREGIRQIFDIYRYLANVGVVGRWVWVYHPTVTGDSARWYLQRLSGDYRRGLIVPKHAVKSPITIYPKGLLPEHTYHVSYQESAATESRSGADLMKNGISLTGVPDGELIYLNVPLHPGSLADRTAPVAPSGVAVQVATHMDYSGVALRWKPGRDDNWISYYQIYRNGISLAKVAKGTFYFDHSLGADLAATYAVAAVDGSGNHSALVSAVPVRKIAAIVWDDTSHALTYTGAGWQHRTGQWTVAHGTEAHSQTPGDAVSFTFEGSQITWYGRMGPDQGVAAVYLDGVLDRVVDTYDGSAIPTIALYSRTFAGIEKHTVKIVALDAETSEDPAAGKGITVDGIQVGREARRVISPAHTSIRYRGPGWKHGPSSAGLSQGGASSNKAGDLAEYTFTGRGITWVGRRCATCGWADVYVDGQLATSVDTYVAPAPDGSETSNNEQRYVPLFLWQWPTAGQHTIRIVIRPDANIWSEGHAIYLDELQVNP